MIEILDLIGRFTTVIFLVTIFLSAVAWFKGIFPALFRLGNGLAKRKIAIFAKGDIYSSLEDLLTDSKLISKSNIVRISSSSDLGKAEKHTLFLVYWPDWSDDIDKILRLKKDGTALVVYAPRNKGDVPKEKMEELNNMRNVMLSNFRGRLLNDIVVSMITTSYEQ